GLGASVTLMGRDRDALGRAAAAITATAATAAKAAPRSHVAVADVTDADAVVAAFAEAAGALGPVSILVNNAGIARSVPFHRADDAFWRDMLEVNLMGVVRATRAVLPAMVKAGDGRIVTIASTAGLKGYAYVAAYAAAKHAVIGLTRSLALETAKTGVTVNAVCPGYTETDILKTAVDTIVAKTGRSEDAARAELAATNPQARFVDPVEVAEAVAWLCLPSSAAITGQAIAVAGGEVM
ncbi:MAG: SDR family oxidoreductase, partial [Alphaproteobacteria bacterium]|nr:SDR family oxidoreductase [Alphaproteobacteria bacterium]